MFTFLDRKRPQTNKPRVIWHTISCFVVSFQTAAILLRTLNLYQKTLQLYDRTFLGGVEFFFFFFLLVFFFFLLVFFFCISCYVCVNSIKFAQTLNIFLFIQRELFYIV